MTCELCEDQGMIIDEGPPRRARDCQCRIDLRRQQQLERSGIPPRYQRKTFEEYDGSISPSAGVALLTCRRFVDEWPTNRHLGIMLTGPVGVGKTHLLSVVLMECHRRYGARVAFVDLPELFSKIKATFDPQWMETEWGLLKPLLSADLLVIDELAAARSSDWNFSMTEQILNSRYNSDKSTLITTNFQNRVAGWTPTAQPPEQKPQLVAGAPRTFADRSSAINPNMTAARRDTLGDRIGARMHSRVQEMCRILEIDAQDQRAAAGLRR